MELKHCPFCGGEAKLKQMQAHLGDFPVGQPGGGFVREPALCYDWHVMCKSCCIHGGTYTDFIFRKESGEVVLKEDSREKAIDAWNRRAD